MTSRRKTGLTTNCAPASIAARAVVASTTVPAPTSTSSGNPLSELPDQLDRPRHGHRHFKHAHAARGQRVHDGAERVRVVETDDRNDALALDARDDVGEMHGRHDVN